MRGRAPTRSGAMALGALASLAVLAFPRALDPATAPAAASDGERRACLAAPCEPGSAGWVERVDARLALRMPTLGEDDRRRVARALVGESQASGIDPLLVLALIEIESGYDPAALSDRGARGLMQLREPTLRREVERAGLEWDGAHDPAVNVQAGIRYLRRLLDAFGRQEIALMAYNAGPNRILAYLREGGIPERFRVYPRKVNAELRRLRRSFGEVRAPAVAAARLRAAPE